MNAVPPTFWNFSPSAREYRTERMQPSLADENDGDLLKRAANGSEEALGYIIAPGSGMASASAGMVRTNAAPSTTMTTIASRDTVEALGQQTIEGVPAEGKRTTSVIPAGAIGNEQDIKIVSETWYSSDLQTTISSTRMDPRMGTEPQRSG